MESQKQYIVLSYDKDEHIPFLLGYSHNLKEKNLALYNSSVIFRNESIVTIQKTGMIQDKDISITFTLSHVNGQEEFVSGNISVNDKLYTISGVYTYNGLQIEQYCYDNIMLVKINDSAFDLLC